MSHNGFEVAVIVASATMSVDSSNYYSTNVCDMELHWGSFGCSRSELAVGVVEVAVSLFAFVVAVGSIHAICLGCSTADCW